MDNFFRMVGDKFGNDIQVCLSFSVTDCRNALRTVNTLLLTWERICGALGQMVFNGFGSGFSGSGSRLVFQWIRVGFSGSGLGWFFNGSGLVFQDQDLGWFFNGPGLVFQFQDIGFSRSGS